MKKLLAKILFSKNEREMIWQALQFSHYTFKRRGNKKGQIAVQVVIDSVKSFMAPKQEPLTREEVEDIVRRIIKDFIDNNKAADERYNETVHQLTMKAIEVDPKRCSECDKRENCAIFKVVVEPTIEVASEEVKDDAGDDNASAEEPTTEKETNNEEQTNLDD